MQLKPNAITTSIPNLSHSLLLTFNLILSITSTLILTLTLSKLITYPLPNSNPKFKPRFDCPLKLKPNLNQNPNLKVIFNPKYGSNSNTDSKRNPNPTSHIYISSWRKINWNYS